MHCCYDHYLVPLFYQELQMVNFIIPSLFVSWNTSMKRNSHQIFVYSDMQFIKQRQEKACFFPFVY